MAACLLSACAAVEPFVAEEFADWQEATLPDTAHVFRVFLIGDTGDPLDGSVPAFEALAQHLAQADSNSAVVFLGDNIYCCGLVAPDDPDYAIAEQRLQAHIDLVADYPGRVYFIPGNHDWNHSRPGGLDNVRRQEAYVEEALGRDDAFIPSDGLPGPAEVKLTDRIRLVAVDTQWWRHRYDRGFGEGHDDVDIAEPADMLLALDDLILRRDDEDLLVVGHHPIFSRGEHGGFHPWQEHLFPLRMEADWAYLPLPIIGSIYSAFISASGGRQDISHPVSRTLNRGLLRTFSGHERLIFASAHDHSLQYYPVVNGPEVQHFIVSGAGSRPTPVGRGKGAAFTASTYGFTRIDYFADGSAWMSMWGTDTGEDVDLLFQTELLPPEPELIDPGLPGEMEPVDYADSTVVAAISPRYDEVGAVRRFFWGDHNRWAWGTPVEVPVLDLGRQYGGLTPVKRGGGQQTLSLRLEGGNGKEYVLRTIDKDPAGTVPPNLQGTIATDIVQDQIASLHPFGAFVIPPLARAAGLNHTLPQLVYVPDDPRLGIYREQFAGQVVMLEERPNENQRDNLNFGGPEEVVSDGTLYEEINADNDHRVDQQSFVRHRLFDMLLADWDRHRDQWRWAEFEPYELDATLTGEMRTEGKIYRPVPRDRDWAFSRMDGVFPSLAPYFDPKFQTFDESYGSLKGLTLNGLEQDRRFLNELEEEDWVRAANELQAALTDSVIEAAVQTWPAPIYAEDGARFVRILKARRDKLDRVARKVYQLQARVVDVVGSDKHERFEVMRGEATTTVVVYKTSKEGEIRKEIYRRTFDHDDTRELRLYGQDGNDAFLITGSSPRGPLVRAIGGSGSDRFEDDGEVARWGNRTLFYDTASGDDTFTPGPDTRVVESADPLVNLYDPHLFRFNTTTPQLFFGSNVDDGVFLGGGLRWTRQGFRKEPYAATHRLVANISSRTQAFNIVYQNHFVEQFGRWGLGLDAAFESPGSIRNFYGLGNETENTVDDAEFYQARLARGRFLPTLLRPYGSASLLEVGTGIWFVDVREDEERFIGQVQEGISEETFEQQAFAVGRFGLSLDRVDNALNPLQGVRWQGSAEVNAGLGDAITYATLGSELSLYLSPVLSPQFTIAARLGAAHNIGDFPFFGANTLGERENLRGYRSTRFAGRTSAYQNLELRAELFDFSTYLAIGELGVLGFVDNGRVWTDGESSSVWHQGYGGGLWVGLFDMFVLTGTVGHSEEGTPFTLRFGFLY